MNDLFDDSIYLNEDTHTYVLRDNEDMDFKSVTRCVSECFEKFDKYGIASKLVRYADKYQGMTVGELIAEWAATAKFGTKVHKEIEDYLVSSVPPKIDRAKMAIEWLDDYLSKSDYTIHPEIIVYCEKFKIAGTVDLLLYNKTNNIYSLLDWKTSKKISKTAYGGKKGILKETSDLPDTKFNHYALQLSLYRYLLEKNYGINVQEQSIVHLDRDSIKEHPTPYMEDYIVSLLKNYYTA